MVTTAEEFGKKIGEWGFEWKLLLWGTITWWISSMSSPYSS